MDLGSSSVEGSPMGPEADNLGVFYVAKCGKHPQTKRRASAASLAMPRGGCHGLGASSSKRSTGGAGARRLSKSPPGVASATSCFVPASDISELQARLSPEVQDEDEEEEILGIHNPSPAHHLHPSNLKCTCFDPNCKLRSYFESRTKYYESKGATSANYLPSSSNAPSPCGPTDQEGQSSDQLTQAHSDLIAACGDPGKAHTIYECCVSLYQRHPDILSTNASDSGDTVLMQLCARTADTSADPQAKCLLNGQIAAFIQIFCEHAPDLLFVRNRQGSNALELASVTNKVSVSVYLALLYAKYGHNVNETNPQGHSVMHIIARKGDDCSETLGALLRLRNPDGSRFLRYDIVNHGQKTPLDVAIACTEIFSTGKDRTIYDKVIKLFLDAVEADARQIEEGAAANAECYDNAAAVPTGNLSVSALEEEKSSSEVSLTFRNNF